MKNKYNYIKYAFVFFGILFSIPSIIYYIKNKTILGFDKEFCFLLNNSNRLFQTAIYFLIVVGLIILYYLIIKYREKIFKDIKQIFIYILIMSIIFILVIPFWCSDVFYYLGIGRLHSKYGENPYYKTICDYVQENPETDLEKDTVLKQGYINVWGDTTVVYGSIWTLICSGVAKLSLGNIDFGILVFKIINILIHLLNSYMIYKIWRKRSFILIYGLNPFVLIEGISNVHNDIFMLALILIATYMLVNKKNIIATVVALSLATAIKYFAILLLPIFVIYYYRDKKIYMRIVLGGLCILLFIVLVLAYYIPFIQNLEVFKGIQTQQGKMAKSIYITIMQLFPEEQKLPQRINKICTKVFVALYFIKCLWLLFQKKIDLEQEMREHAIYLMLFLFVLITNFQPWYLIWLFYCMFWQTKKNVYYLNNICLASLFANCIFLIYSEAWQYGSIFSMLMIFSIVLLNMLKSNLKITRKVNI